jgi:hypothetical protein
VSAVEPQNTRTRPQRPKSACQTTVTHCQDDPKTRGADDHSHDLDHNLSTRHAPLIWIPYPTLAPPPSSICGRKGSTMTVRSEDLGPDSCSELSELACKGPTELLSGMGGQFATGIGRRMSWLVWSDLDTEDNVEMCGCSGGFMT